MEHVHAFVKEPRPFDQLTGSRAYQLMERLNAGEKVSAKDYQFDFLTTGGIVKVLGWLFDFKPFLHTYLVKDRFYGWQEVYAPNKTYVREHWGTPSWIVRIEEIDA
jgi:hypothetical protein